MTEKAGHIRKSIITDQALPGPGYFVFFQKGVEMAFAQVGKLGCSVKIVIC